MPARVDLHEEVGLLGHGRALLIDDDRGPAGSPLGDETPLRFDRVALPVPGMAHHRIGAQTTTTSARFLTSPRVAETLPTR